MPILQYPNGPVPSPGDVQTVKILALAHILFGGLGLLVGIIVALSTQGDPDFQKLALALLIAQLLCLISGICILFLRLRMLSLVIACIICFIFPVGTLIGIWALMVLTRPGAAALYRSA